MTWNTYSQAARKELYTTNLYSGLSSTLFRSELSGLPYYCLYLVGLEFSHCGLLCLTLPGNRYPSDNDTPRRQSLPHLADRGLCVPQSFIIWSDTGRSRRVWEASRCWVWGWFSIYHFRDARFAPSSSVLWIIHPRVWHSGDQSGMEIFCWDPFSAHNSDAHRWPITSISVRNPYLLS